MQGLLVLLVVSVLASTSHSLSLVPAPTTVPVVTCTHEGETLQVGESRGLYCSPCQCMENGEMKCFYPPCQPPQCDDYIVPEGECCSICPNGPSTEPTPAPTPGPTPGPVVTCMHEGQVVPLGGTRGRSCAPCTCMDNGQMMCAMPSCTRPPCVNPVMKEGDCCQTCPDGPTCEHLGTELKIGESIGGPCAPCRCTEFGMVCAAIMCPAIFCAKPIMEEGHCCPTCAPEPITCKHDGKYYKVGEKTGGPCSPCECQPDGFMACMAIDCLQVFCENPIKKEGECCATCPRNAPATCKHDGKVYQVGDKSGGLCNPCECHPDGNMVCLIIDCPRLPCENPKTKEGQCCQICPVTECPHPRRKNRSLLMGRVWRNRNKECRCDPNSDVPLTECRPRWRNTVKRPTRN